MISRESRTISGERGSNTPSAPIGNSAALIPRYQVTSGPSTLFLELARVVAKDHAADGRGEQHDRRDLEREQVVGQEQAPDLRRAAKRRGHVRLVREPST